MTAAQRQLLERIHGLSIELRIEDGRLKYRAPRGAMTPELKNALAELRDELLYEYGERAGIMEFDGGMPRPEAEARAAAILRGGRA